MSKGPENPSLPQAALAHVPQQAGAARAIGLARAIASKAILAVAVVYVLENTMPAPYRPSDVLGRFHGNIEATDLGTKTDAMGRLTRRQAEEQLLPQSQIKVIEDSLETQKQASNIADAGCFIGQFFTTDPRSDWKGMGDIMRSGCGKGDAIRKNMMDTLNRGVKSNPAR